MYGKQLPVNISDIFKSWTNNPGFPVLTVTRDYSKKSFEVRQERFFASYDKSLNKSSQFFVPLNFATAEKSDFASTLPTHWIKSSENKVVIEDVANANQWIILNNQETGLFEIHFSDTK